METHLLHTLVQASRRLSLHRVTKRVKITSVPWKLPHDDNDDPQIVSEHMFCVNVDKYRNDKILLGTDGAAYYVDLKTQKAKVMLQGYRVTFIANFKDLTFFFFHSANEVEIFKDTKDGEFKSVAKLPSICTNWLTLSWSKFGGHVQQFKDTMYYLQEFKRTLVRVDLNIIHKLTNEGVSNCDSAMHPVSNEVNCFAVSKLNRSQVYYVKGEYELWCNDRQLTSVEPADANEKICVVACGRSNLVIPMYSTAKYSTNFTLFSLKGTKLHSVYSKVSESDSDPSHIDTVEIGGITFVVNCRIYHYFDLLAIVKNKLHIIRDAVPSRSSKDNDSSTVNHSLTLRPLKNGIDVIITQTNFWIEKHTITFK